MQGMKTQNDCMCKDTGATSTIKMQFHFMPLLLRRHYSFRKGSCQFLYKLAKIRVCKPHFRFISTFTDSCANETASSTSVCCISSCIASSSHSDSGHRAHYVFFISTSKASITICFLSWSCPCFDSFSLCFRCFETFFCSLMSIDLPLQLSCEHFA